MVLALGDGFEQGCAQRWGQRQRQERREQDRGGHRQRELLVNHPHRARHERHRDKHRHQHQGDTDDCTADLGHGLACGFARGQPLGHHDPLDVFHHHNGVVHQNPDGQHHAEHRQHVDRETEHQHGGKRAHQGDRHHQCRDQRVSDVLQKQKHHGKHQHHRLDQGVHHLGNRDFDEGRCVVRDGVFNACREVATQFVHLGANQGGSAQGVGFGRQLHAEGGGGLAIEASAVLVFLTADFNPRHVAHTHGRPVRVSPQHDVAKLFRGRKLAFDQHCGSDLLGRAARQITDAARRDLRVLIGNRLIDVCRGQVKADQLLRIDPDAHGPFGAIELGLAHAFDPLDFVHHVAGKVITERDLVQRAVMGRERHQHQKAGRHFLDL